MAQIYDQGLGVPIDKVKALTWYLLAQKKSGHSQDAAILILKSGLTPEEIATAEAQVAAYKPTY